MRQITAKICFAFEQGRTLKINNSKTDGISLWLFGNKIAEWRQGEIWITDAGWQSNSTKERLNGLGGVNIVQREGSWYLNGNEWDGSWISVFQFGSRPQPIQLDPDFVQEVEFDTTLEWIEAGGYNMPIYTVARKDSEAELFACKVILNANSIENRIIETDTAGVYKLNFFLVVRPDDHQKALSILNQI